MVFGSKEWLKFLILVSEGIIRYTIFIRGESGNNGGKLETNKLIRYFFSLK